MVKGTLHVPQSSGGKNQSIEKEIDASTAISNKEKADKNYMLM